MESIKELALTILLQYGMQILLSFILVLIYLFLRGKVLPKLEFYVDQGDLKNDALFKAIILFRLFFGLISLALMLFVWGFDFKWLIAVSSGIIALTGVALFASWSILSNVTAFFILLAHHSYKRGTYIRIFEGDTYIEGVISEINVFNTRLISENKEDIICPNNLLISRPTIINPKIKYTSVGKIQDLITAKESMENTDSSK